jgi:hypothetical protein
MIEPLLIAPLPRRPRRDSLSARSRFALLAGCLAATACAGHAPEPWTTTPVFRDLVSSVSETPGYFDTDNLLSNERSYLHVLSDIRKAGIKGGAYLGVGPDQNFSYIAEIDPEIAFIIDIRHDNVLQHLMFKALFTESRSRLEYLALLFGRPLPVEERSNSETALEELIQYVDDTAPTVASRRHARDRVDKAVRSFGLELDEDDFVAIGQFHDEFINAGLSLRFRSHGRSPRFYYPTYRDLLLEGDRNGRRGNYLAREELFRTVQRLQREDRIIPVTGDLAGGHAIRAIGEYLTQRGFVVSAFYTSNVEFYLFGSGTFTRFVENLRALPLAEHSVIIRSVFHALRGPHPRAVPGYYSTQLAQRMDLLIRRVNEGSYRSYWDVVTRDILDD